jgi:hypothetical protein
MHIRKINVTQPMSLLDALEFRDELEEVLKAYRSDKRIAALMKNRIVPQKEPRTFYLFFWGRQQFPESVGYKLVFQNDGNTSLGLYLEARADGEVTEARIKDLLQTQFQERLCRCYRAVDYVPNRGERGATWIKFCQPVREDLDGNAEAIRDWLVSATLDLVKLGELLKQPSVASRVPA